MVRKAIGAWFAAAACACGMAVAACNTLTGIDNLYEDPCFDPTDCPDGAGHGGAVSDATTDQSSAEGPAPQATGDATLDSAAHGQGPDATGLDAPADTSAADSRPGDTSAPADAAAGGPSGCAPNYLMCGGNCVPSDTRNCGTCGNDCTAIQNVSAAGLTCVGGKCVYGCGSGYADCADAGHGCATSLSQSASCGSCGHACSAQTPICSGSTCVSTCSGATTNLCAMTCTNTQTDPQNCGTCGHACTTTVANASATCSAGACGYQCKTSFGYATFCSATNSCVNTSNDNNNCGACGNACASGTTCSAGQCVCNTTSGCVGCCSGGTTCVRYASQSSNASPGCGQSGSTCAACGLSGETCTGGACGCPSGTAMCTSGCVNLSGSDPANCGACGHACTSPTPVCSGSTCTSNCGGATPDLCGMTCTSTQTDSQNCGACGHACTTTVTNANPVCTAGTCGYQCQVSSGYTLFCKAPNACVDPSNDDNNCGACSNVCGPGTRCSSGHCVCNTTTGCNGCCSSPSTCELYASQSSTSCGKGGGACAMCPPATYWCHLQGPCVVGSCGASLPAPNTTPCTTAPHATSALCDGQGNCRAVGCANGYVNDQGACKVPNCAGVACGGSDGAGGICTGASGTCSQSGQHCNGTGQCVCDGTSCSGCCDATGHCNPSSDATCGTGGGACQVCTPYFSPYNTCSGGTCRGVVGAMCAVDSDCVPGGCYNGSCLGTRGIAGEVSCDSAGLIVCSASAGCSYSNFGGSGTVPACGLGNGSSTMTCDAPNDCPSGQDCCSSFNCGLQLTQQCYSQTVPGVAFSGCPAGGICNTVSPVCDPRAPSCP